MEVLLKDLYDYPLSSSDLGICAVDNLNENLTVYNFPDILFKCICLPYEELEYALHINFSSAPSLVIYFSTEDHFSLSVKRYVNYE